MRLALPSLALLALAACRPGLDWPRVEAMIASEFPDVNQLSTEQLAGWLEAESVEPRLLDTRPPDEFAISHLPGALRIDPDASAGAVLAELERAGWSAGEPVVLYCSVGYRSSRLAERLRQTGVADVYNLEGSIFAWANEGRPLVDAEGPTSLVHPYDERWGKLLAPEHRARL